MFHCFRFRLFPFSRVIHSPGVLAALLAPVQAAGVTSAMQPGIDAYKKQAAAGLGKGHPNFDVSFGDGKVWQQAESRPDPSTNIESARISVPVKSGGEAIGVLPVSLTAANLK
ncbi:hypothetical protein F8A86_07375 [Betaproteobacteria bacterium SCN1]|jgi:hypothetical protein|nr:hypothetical protein F8A86_07375 [Betaproteobacteria bacterium SCN1]MBN8760045.1 hypothetical protein [Thiobacillus sp.]